ncbi:hypothetical protein [uncultured Rhodoferax sp.]|uniref:hypothetical protein n=1 Tax=uncultured Rhodoferax sp. TaxID=223188 RepID=UPI0025E9C512|nr:hypothetical protein [uncultured Rhodoferax sp.]
MDVSKAKTQQVQQTQALLKRSDDTRQTEQRPAQAKQAETRKTEQAKPVVNSQGQTTGRLLNVTA